MLEKKKDHFLRGKKFSRRKAITTAGKVAISAVVAGCIAGAGGYFAGRAAAPPAGTVTSTVTKPGATVTTTVAGTTITKTETVAGPTVTETITKTETIAAPKKPVTIKVNWWPGPESDAIAKIIERWNKYLAPETGINAELVLFGRDVHADKITSMLLAGSPELDIVFEFYLVGKLAPYLEPLDDYFANESLYPYTLTDFYPAGLKAFTVNDKLYGIPTDVSVHVLIYRKDLIPKPPETIDEMVEMAKKFTKKYNPDSPTEYGYIVSGKRLLFNAMLWESLMASAGGTPFEVGKELEAVENLTSPAAKKALQVYTDFIRDGISPPDSITYEYMEANAAFQAEKAPMYIQWNAAIGELRDKEKSPRVWDKVGIAPIPGVKLSDGTVLHRSRTHYLGFSINKASEHKVEAFKFLAYLTTTRAMLDYLKYGGFPPNRAVWVNPEAQAVRTELPELMPIMDKYAYAATTHPEVFTIYDILAKHLSAAWSGEVGVDEALEAAQKELRELLAK